MNDTIKKMKHIVRLKYIIATAVVATLAIATHKACAAGDGTEEGERQEKPVNNLPIDTALRSRLKAFAQRPRAEGKMAFHVFDITADKPVFGYNEDMALPSASCMKLLTGVAGLRLLGCNYKYNTEILTRGNVAADGLLNGDIAFKAGLDPQLMAPDLLPFAKALKQLGIKKLTGQLIVDLTIDQPVKSEMHWYPWDLTFSKYGLLYKGSTRVAGQLKAYLRGQGIAVADSQIVTAATPQGFIVRHTASRDIDDVIKRMWKNSSNTQATSMLYTIGHKANPKAHPVAAGIDYLRTFLSDTLALADSALTIHDGCGLCTYNRLSPRALTTIIAYGYNDDGIRDMLERNLAIAGTDGTLAREMTGSGLRGKIKAKTGTLSHPYGISSLAGICEGSDGHALAFAIMDSEMSVLDARVLQRRLCEALVNAKKGGR